MCSKKFFNLQECIAVTQNYVSSANLRHVLKVLATESEELISGCPIDQRKTLHLRFLDALKGMHPQVYFPGADLS